MSLLFHITPVSFLSCVRLHEWPWPLTLTSRCRRPTMGQLIELNAKFELSTIFHVWTAGAQCSFHYLYHFPSKYVNWPRVNFMVPPSLKMNDHLFHDLMAHDVWWRWTCHFELLVWTEQKDRRTDRPSAIRNAVTNWEGRIMIEMLQIWSSRDAYSLSYVTQEPQYCRRAVLKIRAFKQWSRDIFFGKKYETNSHGHICWFWKCNM